MADQSWMRRLSNVPKRIVPSLNSEREELTNEAREDESRQSPERPSSPSLGRWRARLTQIPASIAEGVNTGLNTASSLLGSAAPQDDSRAGVTEDQSWRRRIAGISAHLTLPFMGSHVAEGIALSPDVQRALRNGTPVVALESTIISHGMPYPQNLETAEAVEQVVRDQGAVPATVAVIEGVPHVGLTSEQLKRIASRGKAVQKTSRRDLPYVIAKKLDGATTVSATMLLAARAGIPVFVTGDLPNLKNSIPRAGLSTVDNGGCAILWTAKGMSFDVDFVRGQADLSEAACEGIGGVHRGGETSLDISSDLTEFAKSPVAVVCAGAKSILDIPRTLEYLETQGVTVAGYGTDEFPAFFNPRSGCRAPCRVDGAEEAASLIQGARQLELGSGVLFGVPIPAEYAAKGAQIERAIQRALDEAREQKLSGPEITPFLLQRVQELTGGASLAANTHLIKNNAAVGAQIARALCKQH